MSNFIKIQISGCLYAFVVALFLTLFLCHHSFVYITNYRLFPHAVIAILLWSFSYFVILFLCSAKKYLVKTVALLIWLLLCFYNGYIYLVSELGGNIGFFAQMTQTLARIQ